MAKTTAMIARSPMSNLRNPITSTCFAARTVNSGFGLQRSLKIFHYRRDRNIAYFSSRAQNDLHGTFGNLLPHRDSKGDTDQVGIFELHSRALVPVIENDVKSGGFQARRDIDRRFQ